MGSTHEQPPACSEQSAAVSHSANNKASLSAHNVPSVLSAALVVTIILRLGSFSRVLGEGWRLSGGGHRAPGLSFSLCFQEVHCMFGVSPKHPPPSRGSRAKSASVGTLPASHVAPPSSKPSPTDSLELRPLQKSLPCDPLWSLPLSAELDVSSCLPLVFPDAEAR